MPKNFFEENPKLMTDFDLLVREAFENRPDLLEAFKRQNQFDMKNEEPTRFALLIAALMKTMPMTDNNKIAKVQAFGESFDKALKHFQGVKRSM